MEDVRRAWGARDMLLDQIARAAGGSMLVHRDASHVLVD